SAVRQVAPAAARDRSVPVLAGMLIEADRTGLTLTATDRYRLATRSLAPSRDDTTAWSAVVGAADVAEAVRGLTSGEISVARDGAGVRLSGAAQRHLPGLDERYPDHRAVLDGLAPVRTRVL